MRFSFIKSCSLKVFLEPSQRGLRRKMKVLDAPFKIAQKECNVKHQVIDED